MYKIFSISLKIGLFAFGYLFSINQITSAQVTSDGTVNTQVNQNENVAEITGGETRGSNLFHSFQDFSVVTGNEASFLNGDNINNIFSRVTGGNISNIDGAIRANGTASLFLINPAGIIFGQNARLDIGGSFYGSTAGSILFEDGEFSATDNLNQPTLTVNAPIGLGFRDNPADITVRGDGNGTRLPDSEIIDTQNALRVGSDATIGIVGGNLVFEDATIKTPGGRVEIGSVNGGRVDLIEVPNGFSFDYSGVNTFRDISISGRSNIDASGEGGGETQVAGGNISITGVSGFVSFTLGNEIGGDTNILASESINISGVENELSFVSAISNRTSSNGTADAGDINIDTGSLSIGDRAAITTESSGQANAGDITINASDSVSIEGQGNTSTISTSVAADGVGDAGNININVGLLNASNGALINTSNGAGKAGNLNINATENVNLANNATLFTSGVPGGSISISARNLSILSGSRFFAGLVSSGISEEKSGDVTINLTEDLTIDQLDTDISTDINNLNAGEGDAGNIEVNARNITFNNGGLIFSASRGEGDVGSITLNASDDITFDGIVGLARSGISNLILPNSTGNIGAINISAQNLNLTNGAAIQSTVSGTADSGDINLDIANTTTVDGSGNITVDGSQSIFELVAGF